MAHNTFVVVGLGNIGTKYRATRHNVGREWVLQCIDSHGLRVESFKSLGHIAWYDHENGKTGLFIPDCYMNESGPGVASVLKYYNIAPDRLCVLHDAMEKKVGVWGMKCGGSARGHNGLKSIISLIGFDFWRLGIGIDHPKNKGLADVSSYVLGVPGEEEAKSLGEVFSRITHHQDILLAGHFSAMTMPR
jgi:PTH1 family peptidyl-tRNA hydrolase